MISQRLKSITERVAKVLEKEIRSNYVAKSNSTQLFRKNYGFTLIELIISTSLLAVIFSYSYKFLDDLIEAKFLITERVGRANEVDNVFARFNRELGRATSRVLPVMEPSSYAPSADIGSRNVYFLSVIDGQFQRVVFVGKRIGQVIPGRQQGVVDSFQIVYRIMRDKDENVLVRDQLPLYEKNKIKLAQQQRITFPLIRGVDEFRMAFYDKKQKVWKEEWGGVPAEIVPALIQIKLKVRGKEYTTILDIAAGHD